MLQTLWGVLAVSFAGGIMLQLWPKNGKMLPYIRFLLSLVLLLMLLSPLLSVFREWKLHDPTAVFRDTVTEDGAETFFSDAVIQGTLRRASDALSALICAGTGIASTDMEVQLTTETKLCDDGGTEVCVTAVTVLLGRAEHRIAAAKIEGLVEETMLCPCTVALREG